MTGHQLSKEAQGVVIMQVGAFVKILLLYRIFPITDDKLPQHGGENAMNDDPFSWTGLERRVIVHPIDLGLVSIEIMES